MAQDDMYVIAYKILAYIYDCMKRGARPADSMLAHDGDMFRIEYSYWATIIKELVDKGYLNGVLVSKMSDGTLIVQFDDPKVTMEGVDFLKENSRMKKALAFLKDTKSALPFI